MRQLFKRLFGRTAPSPVFEGVEKGAGSVFTPREFAYKSGCQLLIGENSMFCGSMFFDKADAKCIIGKRTYVACSIMSAHKVTIGDDVLISSGGAIFDHDSHAIDFESRKNDVTDYIKGKKDWSMVPIKEVVIGNKVWIGYNVTILKGIDIGEGAVVGAGSVVTKNVEPYTLVAGNPARVIRKLL